MIDGEVNEGVKKDGESRGKEFDRLLESTGQSSPGVYTVRKVTDVRHSKNGWQAKVVWECDGSSTWEYYANLSTTACKCSIMPCESISTAAHLLISIRGWGVAAK